MKIAAISGSFWLLLDFTLGGIDTPIKALAILVILDFITGIIAAYKNKELNSAIGFKGILKKAGIFLCIMLAYLLDCAMNTEIFRSFVIAGFAVIEAMSLIENIDRMGGDFLIPAFLRIRLEQIANEKKIKGDR